MNLGGLLELNHKTDHHESISWLITVPNTGRDLSDSNYRGLDEEDGGVYLFMFCAYVSAKIGYIGQTNYVRTCCVHYKKMMETKK